MLIWGWGVLDCGRVITRTRKSSERDIGVTDHLIRVVAGFLNRYLDQLLPSPSSIWVLIDGHIYVTGWLFINQPYNSLSDVPWEHLLEHIKQHLSKLRLTCYTVPLWESPDTV